MFKNNKVIFLVLLIIATFVGYNYFLKKDRPTNGDLAVESQQDQNGQLVIGKDLMAALFKLKSLTIDGAFLKDPIFNSLTDFTVQIAPQEVGRNNPFSPVGGASVVKSSKGL